jgi:hypothetical protein
LKTAKLQKTLPGDNRHFNQVSKSAIGALLICLILLLDAMAACYGLHEWFHKDADKAGHECAVTIFTHGKIESATIGVPVPGATILIEATPQIEFSVFSAATENLPPSRAPPALPAVS